MTAKNTVYTVTPPDLRLPTVGPSVLLLGVDFEDIEPYRSVYEKLHPDIEIVFYASENRLRDDNLCWYRAVAGMASSVFVNVDQLTMEELFIALEAEKNGNQLVFWVSMEDRQPQLRQLLNSYMYRVFDSLDEVQKFVADEYRAAISS